MNLSGNTILITGGSSGIGLALATRFLALGNKVIITGRNREKLERVKKTYPELCIFSGDLSDTRVVEELALCIKQEHPGMNILINNAAIQFNYHFLEAANLANKIDHEISANLAAPLKLTGLLLPLLAEKKHSAVVNVSSGLFMAPKMSAAVYCATKAAMHSFSKTLRYQLEDTAVKVFEIIPALIDTPMTEGRGKSKLSADKLVDAFIKNFRRNKYESYIGKTKLLKLINRLSPVLADRIMKNS